jgi:chitosanase
LAGSVHTCSFVRIPGLALLLALSLAGGLLACSGADATESSGDSTDAISAGGANAAHPGWLSGDTKRRAEALTSLFENSTTEIQYAYVEDIHDGRGFTAGRAGFTTATGDALEVIELYTMRVPQNPLGHYLPRLRVLAKAESGSVVGLDGFAAAWTAAAGDPKFRTAQDDIEDRLYFIPAMKRADALHLATPLARAAVYDAIIQHGEGSDPDGLPALLAKTARSAKGTPATGVDEKTWLEAFLTVRRADLAHASDASTRAAWAESVSRVDTVRAIATSGNYDLHGPIVVHTGDVAGTIE